MKSPISTAVSSVLEQHPWLKVAERVADQHGFFHWDLDFAPVFARIDHHPLHEIEGLADAEVQRTLRLLRGLVDTLALPREQALRASERAVKAIYVHSHMDEETFDVERAIDCCDSNCYADGRTVPVCNYNVLYRDGHVVLPQLRPTTFMAIVVTVIGALRSFDLISVMTSGGSSTSSSERGTEPSRSSPPRSAAATAPGWTRSAGCVPADHALVPTTDRQVAAASWLRAELWVQTKSASPTTPSGAGSRPTSAGRFSRT